MAGQGQKGFGLEVTSKAWGSSHRSFPRECLVVGRARNSAGPAPAAPNGKASDGFLEGFAYCWTGLNTRCRQPVSPFLEFRTPVMDCVAVLSHASF